LAWGVADAARGRGPEVFCGGGRQARSRFWGLEALKAGGLTDIVYIGGYQIDLIKSEYPQFTFCHNADWANNNIMESLMHAEAHMDNGFVCAYSDILYRPETIRRLMGSTHDCTLVCDTDWRARYVQRTEHPEEDGEKVMLDGSMRVAQINRTMPSEDAFGEYIGVARFTPAGAAALKAHYHQAREKHGGGPFQAAKTFRKAYLIDLFQYTIDAGVDMHALPTDGGYMEIDTNQDFQIARKEWGV